MARPIFGRHNWEMRCLLILLLLLAAQPGWAKPNPVPPPQAMSAVPATAGSFDPLPQLVMRAFETVNVLSGKTAPENTFATTFLMQVSGDKLRQVGRELETQYGPIVEVTDVEQTGPSSAKFKISFEKGTSTATMTIEPEAPYKVIGFYVSDFVPLDTSPEAIVKEFQALSGKSGFTISKLTPAGPQEVLGYQSDQQFAIGSAFKLWVLDALAEDIAKGKRKWSDVVMLSAHSLPSGEMQDWPLGSPVTLATLATLMISISDNTATDTLMNLLGRDALAERVLATGHSQPSRMLPMLTTLEAFSLKLAPDDQVLAYSDADDAAQGVILDRLDPALSADLLNPARFGPMPKWINQIEWFASPRDMANVMQSLHQRTDPMVMQILSINPGLSPAIASEFRRFAFKGGSEEGVLSLTWLIQNKVGDWYIVSQSWNHAAPHSVDPNHFAALARQLLDRVK